MIPKLFMVTIFLVLGHIIVILGQKFAGDGSWHVTTFEKCEDHEKYPFKMDVTRKKINRTHDGLDIIFTIPFVIFDAEVKIVICKFMDGGCKPYQVFGDISVVHLTKQFADANTRAIFTMAGMDPPGFPLTPGDYEVRQYIFDYRELPAHGLYGRFDVRAYIIQGFKKIGCLHFISEFEDTD